MVRAAQEQLRNPIAVAMSFNAYARFIETLRPGRRADLQPKAYKRNEEPVRMGGTLPWSFAPRMFVAKSHAGLYILKVVVHGDNQMAVPEVPLTELVRFAMILELSIATASQELTLGVENRTGREQRVDIFLVGYSPGMFEPASLR